jgi:hypothetical protein
VFDGPILDIGARAQLLGQPTAAPASAATPERPPQALVDAARAPRHGALPSAPSPDAAPERALVEDEYLVRMR